MARVSVNADDTDDSDSFFGTLIGYAETLLAEVVFKMRGRIVKNENKTGRVSYSAIVDVGNDPVNGERKQKKKTFQTKKEAEKWLADTIAAVTKGTYVEPSKITVREWLTDWLKSHCKKNLSPTTYEGY